jgi:hypothetical protein
MSEDELVNILASSGFEWGFTADDDFDAEHPDKPTMLEVALRSEDAPKWLAGCKEELASIEKLGVFNLIALAQSISRKVLKGKFIFRIKQNAAGKPIP